MTFEKISKLLNEESVKRNTSLELNAEHPDPLMIASAYPNEFSALVCALFAYGNAKAIVRFLQSLDFSLLDATEKEISTYLQHHYYRFQNAEDVAALFITLRRIKEQNISLETLFLPSYRKDGNVMDGLRSLIKELYEINPYRSRGYQFLLGTIPPARPQSPYKRWHMYLRWMVRKDNLDLGLWKEVHTKDLLMPLDTHTFTLGKKLGLIQRKSYDFQAVLELSRALKKIDPSDPIKYDFALYRLGQEKILP
ncbi:TIGR02757 family protein [Sulfurospirillum barnesii]|uniref:TIGR02757 family protein n=1 Tax=Sulfurospirillum barnesii (strain ATCC 700032 / DSM 10660 / SES-3) TaxID=760154 RepID=I3XWU6_SULBS|nr:TIGR02757 family protein [Sulfurospirillum barnesii]AFL68420.1 TIGR02757 family protein [Sulfurospirillum barnesii SES-3]